MQILKCLMNPQSWRSHSRNKILGFDSMECKLGEGKTDCGSNCGWLLSAIVRVLIVLSTTWLWLKAKVSEWFWRDKRNAVL